MPWKSVSVQSVYGLYGAKFIRKLCGKYSDKTKYEATKSEVNKLELFNRYSTFKASLSKNYFTFWRFEKVFWISRQFVAIKSVHIAHARCVWPLWNQRLHYFIETNCSLSSVVADGEDANGWKTAHFRVAFCLCFKTSPSAKPFIRKWVDLQLNELVSKTHFHMKGFALGLVLKQRQKATRKWPNTAARFDDYQRSRGGGDRVAFWLANLRSRDVYQGLLQAAITEL